MMEPLQQELNLGVASIPTIIEEWCKPQYDPYWDELLQEEQSTCDCVGEQVVQTTDKSIHQQEYTHFIETYWVERKGQKYWYYRYTWKRGEKLLRKYIGSVNSPNRRKCSLVVKEMIDYGATPDEIVEAIEKFKCE